MRRLPTSRRNGRWHLCDRPRRQGLQSSRAPPAVPGAPTLFVGAVGRDAFASDAKKFYRAERIGAHFVEKPALATGTAGILVNASGQNEIIVALGANAALRPGRCARRGPARSPRGRDAT